MAVVKKTISIPEDIYRDTQKFSKNFSKTVVESLEEYVKKKKREHLLCLAGELEDFEDGREFIENIRKEDKKANMERDENWDI